MFSDSCGKAKVNLKKEVANEFATHTLVTFLKTSFLLSLLFGEGLPGKRLWWYGSYDSAEYVVGDKKGEIHYLSCIIFP